MRDGGVKRREERRGGKGERKREGREGGRKDEVISIFKEKKERKYKVPLSLCE